MAIAMVVTLDEYLATDYQPDCEYIDGQLVERNVGQQPHSRTQILTGHWFVTREKGRGFRTLTEQRVWVTPERVRIPDVCLVREEDRDPVVHHPPLLCIEILSPDDRWSRVQESIADYLHFGVPEVWIIDPYARKAWRCVPGQEPQPVIDGILRWRDLPLELHEILPA